MPLLDGRPHRVANWEQLVGRPSSSATLAARIPLLKPLQTLLRHDAGGEINPASFAHRIVARPVVECQAEGDFGLVDLSHFEGNQATEDCGVGRTLQFISQDGELPTEVGTRQNTPEQPPGAPAPGCPSSTAWEIIAAMTFRGPPCDREPSVANSKHSC